MKTNLSLSEQIKFKKPVPKTAPNTRAAAYRWSLIVKGFQLKNQSDYAPLNLENKLRKCVFLIKELPLMCEGSL